MGPLLIVMAHFVNQKIGPLIWVNTVGEQVDSRSQEQRVVPFFSVAFLNGLGCLASF